jgi:FkbM family methyltransferase
MLTYENDIVTRQLLDFGAHTRPELAFLLSSVRNGDRIFDLGAHIGTFAIPLAQKVGPTGRIVAVEAVREYCFVAAENIALNELSDRIELRCALIAPSDRFEVVHDDANTGATFFRASGDVWRGDVVTIDTLAADTFVPDVIKIDVEGLEAWALTTSTVVRNRKPVIYAEISARQLSRAGASVSDLGNFLRGLGYRLFRNAGARNAAHDQFEPREIDALSEEPRLYDVLAIHENDGRLRGLSASIGR